MTLKNTRTTWLAAGCCILTVLGGCLAPPTSFEVRVLDDVTGTPIQNALVECGSGSRVNWATIVKSPEYEFAYTDSQGCAVLHTFRGSAALSGWYSGAGARAPGFMENSYSFQTEMPHDSRVQMRDGVLEFRLERYNSGARVDYKAKPIVVERVDRGMSDPANRPPYRPYPKE